MPDETVTVFDAPPEPSPLYDAWVVIANARDWLADDEQGRQWREAAERWRDANGFGVPSAASAR